MITTVQDNLAKLMSTEDITILQKAEATAYFDVNKRILVIPTWKNLSDIVIESLIGHEIGHALYTDSKSWMEAVELREPNEVFRDYLNVVEDVRIETLVKRRYPGMKKIFFYGYKQIIDNGIIEISDIDKLPIIDRLNVYFKFNGIIPLSPSEREEYFIQKMESITTFDEVIEIAIELFDSEKQEGRSTSSTYSSVLYSSDDSENDEENAEASEYSESASHSDESEQTESDVEKRDQRSNENSDSADRSESQEAENNLQQKTERSDGSNGSNGSRGSRGGLSKTPSRSKTLKDLNESLTDLVDYGARPIYVDIPSPNLDKIIHPYELIKEDFENLRLIEKTSDTEEGEIDVEDYFDNKNTLSVFSKKHKTNISLHKQLFEMRKKASEYNKTMTFRTGTLDTNKLYSYKYNDQIFKTFEVKPNGKNHGLIFIMDFSGSMGSYLSGAKTKALELIVFCKQINIPFVLYGFFDTFEARNPIDTFDLNVGKSDFTIGVDPSFRLLELLSSRMSESDFKKMVDVFLKSIGVYSVWGRSGGRYSLGGTPLAETHLCLDALVSKFRNETRAKIVNVVYFTDGSGSTPSAIRKGTDYRSLSYDYGQSQSGGKAFVLHDHKTKKNYDACNLPNTVYPLAPINILSVMKNRMQNVNVINFLITNDIVSCIPLESRSKHFSNIGMSYEKVLKQDWYKKRDSFYRFNSEYVVVEDSSLDAFDTTFICSVEMFKKSKTKTNKATDSLQDTISQFSKSSRTKKRVNIMISKFIDLIV
jgi:hypothetical protein